MHEYELKKKKLNPEAQTYISKCCVCACVCIFVYCYIALAERPDASFSLFLLDEEACKIYMNSRSLEALALSIARRWH